MRRALIGAGALVFALACHGLANAQTGGKKPNVLIIWGDDID